MDTLFVLRTLDVIGIYVFAISGGLVAVRNDLDIIGVLTIAFLPAVGGGTLRDLLLGVPVFWLDDPITLGIVVFGGLSAFLAPGFWSRLRVLGWFDAIGLSLFAMVGAYKSATLGHHVGVTMMMGAITAAAGGVIRDVVCGETVMMLREEIYISAALVGAGVFCALNFFDVATPVSLLAGAASAFTIRSVAIVFKLSLPTPNRAPHWPRQD